jgi:hypothetical protein
MGCLSAAAESGRVRKLYRFSTLYCIVAYFLSFVNWFLKNLCKNEKSEKRLLESRAKTALMPALLQRTFPPE